MKALFMVPTVSDLSFVNGWQPESVLSPGFTSGGQKIGYANRIFSVQRPIPVCESIPRTTWVQGLFPRRNQDKS